jgi:hypothetical protein
VEAAGAIIPTPGPAECRKGEMNDPSAKMLASALNRYFNHPKMRRAVVDVFFFLTSMFSRAETNEPRLSCIWATCCDSEREALLMSLATLVVSEPYFNPLSHDLDAPSMRRAIRYANWAWQRRIALVAREHQLASSRRRPRW